MEIFLGLMSLGFARIGY